MPSRRRAKARGSTAERELLSKLYAKGWGAVRAAGSGSVPLEVPDIIAGDGKTSYGIEVKYCSKNKQYLKAQEILDLKEFSYRFGCQAWIAVKFTRRGWWFIRAHEMRSTGKHYGISYEEAQETALDFEAFTKTT